MQPKKSKMKKIILLALVSLVTSCISTKSTIQNINDKALMPKVVGDHFEIKQMANDGKYGFHQDYPINLGFYKTEASNLNNVKRFFNGITAANGEKLSYKKIDTCCPYPSKNNAVGVGTLEIYEVWIDGKTDKWLLYINLTDKGDVLYPKGFLPKK